MSYVDSERAKYRREHSDKDMKACQKLHDMGVHNVPIEGAYKKLKKRIDMLDRMFSNWAVRIGEGGKDKGKFVEEFFHFDYMEKVFSKEGREEIAREIEDILWDEGYGDYQVILHKEFSSYLEAFFSPEHAGPNIEISWTRLD